MTNEEAVRKLEYSKTAYQMLIDEKVDSGKLVGKDVKGEWKANTPLDEAYKSMIEALEMGIKAIKALEQEPCGDTISRKSLLEEIENGIKAGNYEEGYEEYPHINDMDDIIECIKYADSVQPKPKTDVLDKIRAEIEQAKDTDFQRNRKTYDKCLEIIDKYRAESSERI